jgi:hypothetical protein
MTQVKLTAELCSATHAIQRTVSLRRACLVYQGDSRMNRAIRLEMDRPNQP